MVALAATKEEVIERLKADVYNANGVWDLSKVCQMLSVFRKLHADEFLNLGPNIPLQVVPVKDTSTGCLYYRNTRDHDSKEIGAAPRTLKHSTSVIHRLVLCIYIPLLPYKSVRRRYTIFKSNALMTVATFFARPDCIH